jgi:hypothetical protein
VAAGKIAVSAAAQIAKLPAEQQQQVVAGIERGLKPKQALAQVKMNQAELVVPVDDAGLPLPEYAVPAFRARKDLQALSAIWKPADKCLSTWPHPQPAFISMPRASTSISSRLSTKS